MAKVDKGDKLTGGVLRRSKKRVYFRGDGSGGTVASAWPKRRGGLNANSELQQAWIDHFKAGIGMAKLAGGCTRAVAEGLADQPFSPNYFWRDAIMSAFNGKMINYAGDGTGTNARYGPEGPEQVFRVTTPTANVYNSANQNVLSGIETRLTANSIWWDNNAFWSASPTPARLTFKSKGLYLIGCTVVFPSGGSSAARRIRFIVNNAGIPYWNEVGNTSSTQRLELTGLWYLEAGDFLEILGQRGGGNGTIKLDSFWAVGIVPEMVS